MKEYQPNLTPEVKAELEAEIAAFDKEKTLAELEENAKPKRDAPGYSKWRADNFPDNVGNGAAEAEPDILSENDAVKFIKPTFSKQIVLATLEIKELLSFRESQCWQAVMRNGLSIKETAKRLRIGERTVEEYIARAKAKVLEHFKDGIPE